MKQTTAEPWQKARTQRVEWDRPAGAIRWPEGKRFAFTVFDDPDSQTLEDSRVIYSFLADLGMFTTKGIWAVGPYRVDSSKCETCENPAYREHVVDLHRQGFEMGFHGASLYSSPREVTMKALEFYRESFGDYPAAMSNHFGNAEGIYWGDARLTGMRRTLYKAATFNKRSGQYSGESEESPYFWGDLCSGRIRYCRNFVFRDIDTLKLCPEMPYYDPARPLVKLWYASSEGAEAPAFLETIREANQDALEEAGSACIMYTHFGKGFVENGRLNPRFRALMERLSRKGGWFVPVSAVLDCIVSQRGKHILTAAERSRLEWRWLSQKLMRGTA